MREFHEAGTAGMAHPGKGLSCAGMNGVWPQEMPFSEPEIGSGSVCGTSLRHLGANRELQKVLKQTSALNRTRLKKKSYSVKRKEDD